MESAWLSFGWVLFIHGLVFMIQLPVLHLYHLGVPMLLGAYGLRRDPVSWAVVLGLSLVAFFVRNEALVTVLLLGAAGAWRRHSEGTVLWKWSPICAVAV